MKARFPEVFVTVEHEWGAGELEMSGAPFTFSDDRVDYSRRAPLLGEHTSEVLRELGIDEVEIERLAEEGVVVVGGAADGGGR